MNVRRRLRGFTLVELLVGIVIATLVYAGWFTFARAESLRERGKTLSTAVAPYATGLFAYTLAYRAQLVDPAGTIAAVVTPLQPTCQNLKDLIPALRDYTCSLPEQSGTPVFAITLIPSGCSGTACDMALSVTPSRPISNTTDGPEIVSAAVHHYGAEAGQSFFNYGTLIKGPDWQYANPLGDVPYVFGTYAVYGASMLSKFLTVYDTRDPNFLGNVTIHQSTTVTGTITTLGGLVVTDPGTGCRQVELTTTGRIIARSATCVDRAVTDGATGTLETRSATGSTTVRIGDDIKVFNASGIDKAGARFVVGGDSELYADRFRNTAGTAGINADGSVFGTTATVSSLVINTAEVAGAPCPANAFARNSGGRWMECVSGVWRISGMVQAAVGDSCISGFAEQAGATTTPLVCRNNTYVNLNQAIGLVSIIDSVAVIDGSVVATPTCAPTATPVLLTEITRFQTPVGGGTTRLAYTGAGPWAISITGAGGGEAIVWRACQYPTF